MVLTIVMILLILVSLLLIGAVLIQPGKGDMISGMSGLTGQFSNVLGNKRATDMLTKITWGLAAFVMVVTILTNIFLVGGPSSAPSNALPTEGRAIPKTTQPTTPPIATPPAQK